MRDGKVISRQSSNSKFVMQNGQALQVQVSQNTNPTQNRYQDIQKIYQKKVYNQNIQSQ